MALKVVQEEDETAEEYGDEELWSSWFRKLVMSSGSEEASPVPDDGGVPYRSSIIGSEKEENLKKKKNLFWKQEKGKIIRGKALCPSSAALFSCTLNERFSGFVLCLVAVFLLGLPLQRRFKLSNGGWFF